MISKMLAEKRSLNERTRLSWDPSQVPIKGEGKFIGDVCLSLPYINIEKKYFIQNCRLFKSNGTEITNEQLFELEFGGPLYLRVQEILKNHLDEAVVHDPALCTHCRKFRAEGLEAMMQHVIDVHPEVIAKMARVDLTPAPAEAETKTDRIDFLCQSCDRTFKNAGGLRLHRLKVHDKAA